jgi:hypothetical protein
MSASEHGMKDKESENQGSIGMPEKRRLGYSVFLFWARVLPLGYKILFQCDSYKGFYFQKKSAVRNLFFLKSPYLDNRLEHVTKI